MSTEHEKVAVATPSEHSGTIQKDEEAYHGEAVNERKLIAKLDFRLLPAVTVLYLLSFLDRANVGNANAEGLSTDINIEPSDYLIGLTLFFIGYVLLEVPWNIILKRTSPKFWLPTITAVWGVIAALQGLVTNRAGFWAVRFFLGLVEGGLFPGVVFYLSMWYVRRERQFRVALFFSAAALAGAFGGILAYGISFMNGVGGEYGWQWIFYIEGILTFLVGLSAYLFIENYPSTAKFITEPERAFLQERLAKDSDLTENEGFSWANVKDALSDPKVWMYSFSYHWLSLPLYTIALFLPTIIEDLGYSAADAQLLTIPPYALAALLTVLVAWVSEYVGRRAPFMIGGMVIAMIGYSILLGNTNPTGDPGVSYAGTFFTAAGVYPSVALSLSWPAVNVSGPTKRGVANALQITIGNLGAAIGVQLYRSEWGPRYIVGHTTAMVYCFISLCWTCMIWWYLSKENKKKEAALPGSGVEGGAGGLKGDHDLRWRFLR